MPILQEDIEACFPTLRNIAQPTDAPAPEAHPTRTRQKSILEVSFARPTISSFGRVMSDISPPTPVAPRPVSKPIPKMDFQPTKLTPDEKALVRETWERRVGEGPEAHVSSAHELIRLLERLGIIQVAEIRTHLEQLYTALTVDYRGNASSKLFYGQFVNVLQRCKTLALVVQARKLHEAWKDVSSPSRLRHVESVHRSRHVQDHHSHLSQEDLLQVFGALAQQKQSGGGKGKDTRAGGGDGSVTDVSAVLPEDNNEASMRSSSEPASRITTPSPFITVSAERLDEFAKQYMLLPQALIPADYLTQASSIPRRVSSPAVGTPTTTALNELLGTSPTVTTAEEPMALDGGGVDAGSPDRIVSVPSLTASNRAGSYEGELPVDVRSTSRSTDTRATVLNPIYRNQPITAEDLVALLDGEGMEEDEDSLDGDTFDESIADVWANNPHSSALDRSDVKELSYWEEAEALSASYATPKRRKGDLHGAAPQTGLLVQPVDEFLTNTQRKSAFSSLREPNSTTVLFNKRKIEKQKALDKGVRSPSRTEKVERWQYQRDEKLKKNQEVISNSSKYLKDRLPSIQSTR